MVACCCKRGRWVVSSVTRGACCLSGAYCRGFDPVAQYRGVLLSCGTCAVHTAAMAGLLQLWLLRKCHNVGDENVWECTAEGGWFVAPGV